MPESARCRAHGQIAHAVAEIGIYRCSVQEHTQRMQDHEDRIRQKCKASEYVANMQLAHFGKTEWTGWRYNEVIGWLRLYAFPLQWFAQHATIRAEFYAVDAKRISASLKRKRYLYDGAAFEIDVDEGVFSEGIFAHVTNKIYSWAEGWRLKGMRPILRFGTA